MTASIRGLEIGPGLGRAGHPPDHWHRFEPVYLRSIIHRNVTMGIFGRCALMPAIDGGRRIMAMGQIQLIYDRAPSARCAALFRPQLRISPACTAGGAR
jgi:hypothetical protein